MKSFSCFLLTLIFNCFFFIACSVKNQEKKLDSLNQQISNSKRNNLLKHRENQTKALEKLDKMVEEILETDLPGMCAFSFPPAPPQKPPNSKSDGHLCEMARER